MEYLVKDKKLELKYEAGKGAWTYHIQIPNTKHIVGKWGTLKVSGTIDNYKIDSINLFTISGQDKLISINSKIRKSINKSGGDIVNVTLFLLNSKKQITENEIIETFKDSGVLKAFNKIAKDEREEIMIKITSLKSEDKQVKMILKYIDQLSKWKRVILSKYNPFTFISAPLTNERCNNNAMIELLIIRKTLLIYNSGIKTKDTKIIIVFW